jgi:cyanophycinase
MSNQAKGRLIIIGGSEDTDGDREILKEVARAAKRRDSSGHLVVITAATESPEKSAEKYVPLFKGLDIKKVDILDIRAREDAHNEENVEMIKRAPAVFFTGGDQLRITSQIGDSPIFQCLHTIYQDGATIAGTSAGAAAMPDTMLIAGPGDESNRISALDMAPGLGLIEGVVIDSHFAQRGRMGRLLGAIAQNPRNLGVGIDEDTAIVVEGNLFRVIGTGAVYLVDGSDIAYSSLSENNPEGIVTIHNVKLHVLGAEECFDLVERQPLLPESKVEVG